MDTSDQLLCVFSGRIEERDGSHVIEVPQRELRLGDVREDEVYRVAILPAGVQSDTEDATSRSEQGRHVQERPVDEGDVFDVEIEDIGDQGDGIARVGPGYVIIVPGTEMGERVSVEITEARENMAFAEIVDRHDPMR